MIASVEPDRHDMRTVVAETPRLRLVRFELRDAAFILQLLNEPGWLRFIGDKAVHSLEDAERYLRAGPLDLYERFGFGMYRVERKADGAPIGMCGLIKRDSLECVDIGFALLEHVAGHGFAYEAAAAMLVHAQQLGLERLMAITTPDNTRSQKLLRRLGLRFDRTIQIAQDPLHLYITELN